MLRPDEFECEIGDPESVGELEDLILASEPEVVAFDTFPGKFDFLKDVGGDVIAAKDEVELRAALDGSSGPPQE